MATSVDYVEFVMEQLLNFNLGEIRYRKMFGEYMVYMDNKPIMLVCDNTVYIKQLPELATMMEGEESGHPYKGAKIHYILDIENEEKCLEVIPVLQKLIPVPKPRKPKAPKA